MAEPARERLSGLNTYFDKRFERQAVKILPGEYFASNTATMIVTVLGSCVAACLQDCKNKVHGMNHFLLPCDYPGDNHGHGGPARYGMHAMELLINDMIRLGADRRHIQAKVFGGGNVMSKLSHSCVGEKNAEFVIDYLRTEHIPVRAKDLLGDYPRKIYFLPESGQVRVKKIKRLQNTTIIDRESIYQRKLKEQHLRTTFDFFNVEPQ
ncbi:chemoreceptor glutamine deamidase CheD [Salinimonas chungwhensis]|uniref:chemoreceptor glutamine deamidase CheD n=1 Tax=Salinimonas chungwhensis TaxID=265425 RepID=UPI00036CA40F|nr:chemoreceptor glutamine deamidase CheD [Salinimonas chungwhensis]